MPLRRRGVDHTAVAHVRSAIQLRIRIQQLPPRSGPRHADRGKLLQALINLLMNAAEAMDPRHAERNEIRCATRYQGGKVRFLGLVLLR